ncbi:MAG: DUF1223 domain-containing protein [Terrimonas sp.]|nr:DUF1223 domain-containing protein [Terrimonas sp.]
MKYFILGVITIFLVSLGAAGITNHHKNDPVSVRIKKPVPEPSPFVLLELFTSEGCSSCPRADALLPELAMTEPGVITIAFHVDYWNYLGWNDQFSNKIFSDRQYEYGRRFRLASVYTPQLVFNGKREIVGSDKAKAKTLIRDLLKVRPLTQILIRKTETENNSLKIEYTIKGDFENTRLCVAIIQKKAIVKIKSGENRGRELAHSNIVINYLEQTPLENAQIKVPFSISEKGNRGLVLFLQNRKTLEISDAIMADF